jgi:NAD(P)-dependent dehydrogenase (short-subunit alcohol dehydrogenase family)
MFDGEVAVVTGAVSGIGAAFADLYVARGGSVVVADIQDAAGAAFCARLGRAVYVHADVSREDDVAAAIDLAMQRFGRLDCMVNNAGLVGSVGSIDQIRAEHWRGTLAVLLDSVFYGMKHAARVMKPAASGTILSVASIAGVAGGLGPHAYTAAKHAVIGLTKSVGADLAAHGIRVNAVAPGATATQLVAERRGSMAAATASVAETSPLKRPILAMDIAETLAFLASSASANISGQTIVVDGGRTAFGQAAIGAPNFHRMEAGFSGPSTLAVPVGGPEQV